MNSGTARAGILVVALAVAVALFVVLQDSGDDSDDSSGTTTAAEQPKDATAAAPPAEPARETIELRGGAPVGGVRELTYTAGDQVRLTVDLDEPQEDVHIHGYDIEVLAPQKAADFDFKADIEGIFELEAHGPSGDVVLAEIRVEPS